MEAAAARTTKLPFVGRERELRQLREAWAAALGGRTTVVLVGGEAGSGKSRLVETFLDADGRHARTCVGRAWEAGGTPAFWLWREVLTIDDPAGPTATPDAAPFAAEPGEAERLRVFDAIAARVRDAARREPLIVWFDDVHAADQPSRVLLRFVVRAVRDAPLLVVLTYRDDEVAGADGELLADLARASAARTISLPGLAATEIADLATQAGLQASESDMSALHRDTAGNPLFAGEAIRLLLADAGAAARPLRSIAPTVRATIARRVSRLPESCQQALDVAAVIGRDFDVQTVAAVLGRPVPIVLDELEPAAASRVIVDVAGPAGDMRFSHAIVQSVLYDAIRPSQRISLHSSIADALEQRGAPGTARLRQLAHHLLAAAPGGDVARAVEAARRAGDDALANYGYEDAAGLYAAALALAEGDATLGLDVRCRLQLALGDAEARSGRLRASKSTFLAAAATARSAGLGEHLAGAALGYGGRWIWGRAGGDAHLVPLLEDALAALGPDDDLQRVRVLARLACARRSDPDREVAAGLAAAAVQLAERCGEPAALAYAYDAQLGAIYWYDNPARRLALIEERWPAVRAHGDQERLLNLLLGRVSAHLELGAIDDATAALQQMRQLAEHVRLPAYQWMVASIAAMLELMRGDIAPATAQMDQELSLGTDSITSEAGVAHRVHRIALAMATGDGGDLDRELRDAIASEPWHPLLRCLLAEHHLLAGDRERARAEAAELSAGRFARLLPRDNEWLLCATVMADLCAAVGDPEAIAWLHDALAPVADLNVVGVSELCRGSANRSVGVLAAALGRDGEAEAHLERAIAHNRAMGATVWELRARIDLARLRLRRGDGSANIELDAVTARAAELGLHGLADLAAAVRPTASPVTVAAERRSGAAGVFRREGGVWRIAFDGAELHLPGTRGLDHLATLLARPGVDVAAIELTTPGAGTALDDATRGLPMIDAQAQREYRRRIADLMEDIEEATRWNDPERAERARDELEFIERELTATTGLGGRTRQTGSAAERARVNVTRAIKSSLERIESGCPPLGAHLRATVRTGTFCSYRPDPRLAVCWDTGSTGAGRLLQ